MSGSWCKRLRRVHASRSLGCLPEPAQPLQSLPHPPAGDNVMNMVFVGAECAPWSKTGGLGDVMGSLPKAMQRRGHRVMVVAPRYGMYDDAFDTGTRQMYKCAVQLSSGLYNSCRSRHAGSSASVVLVSFFLCLRQVYASNMILFRASR